MKALKDNLDYIRDKNWLPVMAKDRSHALQIGNRMMPPDLKKWGFSTGIFEGEDYFRITYGKYIKTGR